MSTSALSHMLVMIDKRIQDMMQQFAYDFRAWLCGLLCFGDASDNTTLVLSLRHWNKDSCRTSFYLTVIERRLKDSQPYSPGRDSVFYASLRR